MTPSYPPIVTVTITVVHSAEPKSCIEQSSHYRTYLDTVDGGSGVMCEIGAICQNWHFNLEMVHLIIFKLQHVGVFWTVSGRLAVAHKANESEKDIHYFCYAKCFKIALWGPRKIHRFQVKMPISCTSWSPPHQQYQDKFCNGSFVHYSSSARLNELLLRNPAPLKPPKPRRFKSNSKVTQTWVSGSPPK